MQKQDQSPIKFIENGIKKLVNSKDQKVKQRIFLELNMFRKDPTTLIPYLTKKNQYHPQKGFLTKQGPAPINELIGTLYSRDKMPAVLENQFLTLIAEYIVQSFSSVKSLEEIKLSEAMAKHLRNELNQCEEYNFSGKISCVIGIGFQNEPFEPLMSLLIDDGNEMRKNREIVLNRNHRFVGLATGQIPFKRELRVCIFLLTSNISKK